ncbi:MAG: hypothetical protein R6W90_03050 [Ignavibacteriaceae bacterium]
MKYFKTLFIVLLPLIAYSCNISESSSDDYIYYNSFESGKDTTGWEGLSSFLLVKEASPKGGTGSLLIGGGCLQPAGKKEFTIVEEGYYVLECMGKTKTNGGSICLTNKPPNDGYENTQRCIQINSIQWASYISNEVFCEAGSQLLLEIYAGGFVPSDINIDELKIKKL